MSVRVRRGMIETKTDNTPRHIQLDSSVPTVCHGHQKALEQQKSTQQKGKWVINGAQSVCDVEGGVGDVEAELEPGLEDKGIYRD